jgi:hypothetical protein
VVRRITGTDTLILDRAQIDLPERFRQPFVSYATLRQRRHPLWGESGVPYGRFELERCI